jgi:pimeloyl-ACP methyl ester carboxylesterase
VSALLKPLLYTLCLILAFSTGCARFRHLRGQNARLDALSKIEGKVEVKDWKGEPLMLVVMIKPAQTGVPIIIKGRIALNKPGPYTVVLQPDVYMVGVFEDTNKNSKYDPGERAGTFKNFAGIPLKEGEVKKQVDLNVTDELPQLLRQPAQDLKVVEATPMVDDGKVMSLSDARFAPENGPLGAWEPVTFLEKVGMGVFLLQAYDPEKTPVVFVHGMSGHPREFETLIKCLDGKPFQPWVVQYASGWALEPIARGLSYRLNNLQRQHSFSKLYVVAHSMGGLVSRRMLREHLETNPKPFITKFVTIVSPLGGMPSADMGVKMAPAVVPSWRDIGPRSEYVKHLYDKALPSEIEYSLFFAFHDDKASDTVVELASQLRKEARHEAASLAAFQNTHTGVLKDPETCKALLKTLSR